MCTPSSLLTHRADRCLHHCGCAWRGVGGGCWGVGGMGWRGDGGEGGSPSATGPLLPSNSPHFAFLRPSLPLLLLSLSPSHLFPKFFHFLLLKAKKNQKPTTPSTPSLVLPPPKSPFPPKNNSHLSSSLPSNSPHFAFPPLCSMLEGGARGSPRLPQVHLFL